MLKKILTFLYENKGEEFTATEISQKTRIGKNIVEKILEIGSENPPLFTFYVKQNPDGIHEKVWSLDSHAELLIEEGLKIPQEIIDKVNAIDLVPEKPAKEEKEEIELLSSSAKEYELIEEETLPAIHGALDFTHDMGFVSTPITVKVRDDKGEYQTVKTAVITSGREAIVLDWETIKKGIDGKFRFGVIPTNLRERWSKKSVYDFLHNRNESHTAKEIFDVINEKIRFYMELMDDREYDLLSIWCIMTYLFPMFTTLPMLYISAIRGSGKTKLVTLLGCMCYSNTGKPTVSISTPSFFRTIQESRSTILIDENERLKDKQKAELRELVNACYKKGSVVKRTEERLRMGGMKGFVNIEFDVFAPVSMASIHPIDDVVESRCIRIGLQRTNNKIVGNRMVILESYEWQDIRDMLYTYAMENFDEVRERYKEFHKFFISTPYTLPTSSIPTLSTSITPKDVEDVQNEQNIHDKNIYNDKQRTKTIYTQTTPPTPYNNTLTIQNNTPIKLTLPTLSTSTEYLSEIYKLVYSRDLELWLPILTIASLISQETLKRISDLAIEKTTERITEDITEEINMIIVESLVRTVDKADWYSLSNLITELKDFYPEGEWIKTRWYSNTLKTLGLYTAKNKKRVKSGMVVFLKPEQVQELGKRLGLNVDEILQFKDKYDLEYLKEERMSQTEKFMKALESFGDEEIETEKLMEKVRQTGISDFKANEILGKLCHEGVLIKPREGYVKRITGLLKDYVD